MSDCISREDALLCLTGEFEKDKEYSPEELIAMFGKRIKGLPPVTPTIKTGHWIAESDDCISRDAAISAAKHIFESNSEMKAFCMMKMLNELPSAKPKADVDALINKIETEFSWSMYDDWGNSTYLHDELIDFIREWAESGERWN